MTQVPGAVLARFEACLAAKNISENLRSHYKKWLRFYLDFCSKYRRDANKIESLADFQQKLREKGQTEMQQKQAAHAVSLYLDSGQASAFARPSVSSPASVHHTVEVSEIQRPMQYTARPEQHAGAAPLVPQLLNAACKQSQYPQGLLLAPVVAADKLQPMTGASWVAQFTRLAEEIQVRQYSPKTLKTYRQWLRQFQAFT